MMTRESFFVEIALTFASNISAGPYMRYFYSLLLLLSFVLISAQAESKVLYGYNIPEAAIEAKARQQFRTDLFVNHPLLKAHKTTSDIQKERPFKDRSGDFLALLLLVAVVGIFRFSNPIYFRNLFKAFRNQTLSTRQLKDQLKQDSAAGLVMDLIFCTSLGLYLFYVIEHLNHSKILSKYPPFIIILGLVLLFVGVYMFRYLFLKFTGWVFNISEITDNYTFNVFLINKVMGVLIIPFTVVLAFGEGAWVQVTLFLSLVLIGILFLNRYLRSGVVFGYFIKFSKFHFFMYLCASELLPIAILVKVLSRWFISL